MTGSIGSIYSNGSISSLSFSCGSGSICGSEKEEEAENFFFPNCYESDHEHLLASREKHEGSEENIINSEICINACEIHNDASSSEKLSESYGSFYENCSVDDFYPEQFGLLEDPGVVRFECLDYPPTVIEGSDEILGTGFQHSNRYFQISCDSLTQAVPMNSVHNARRIFSRSEGDISHQDDYQDCQYLVDGEEMLACDDYQTEEINGEVGGMY